MTSTPFCPSFHMGLEQALEFDDPRVLPSQLSNLMGKSSI
jgi:hypothetical protein